MSASMAASSLPMISGGSEHTNSPIQVIRQKFVGRTDIVSWCPVLNLLVVSMNKTSVWAYRLKGERVYSANNKLEVTAIAFRDDGRIFCLIGIDGFLKVYDSNDGRLLKTIKHCFGPVSSLLWDEYTDTPVNPLDGLYEVKTLDQMPQLVEDNSGSSFGVLEKSGLNFMVIACETNAHICFSGMLTVLSIAAPSGIHFVKHMRTANAGSLCFLGRQSSGLLCIVHFSMKSECPHLLRVIKTLVSLEAACSLLDSRIDALQAEVEPYFTFLDRTLDNLRDSIASKNTPRLGIINHLSEALLTGLIPSELKDFWLNQLGERGIRRLTKLGNTCYDTLRERIFAQVIQALDKIVVLLGQLKGLATWLRDSQSSYDYGLSVETIESMISSCQFLLGQLFAAIRDINEEQQLFVSFVNWIKAEIVDKISKEDDIQSYLARPFPLGFTHANVMTFISRHLFNSKLYAYFDCATACEIVTQTECSRNFSLAIELVLELKNTVTSDFGKLYCSQLAPDIVELPEFGQSHESVMNLCYSPADKCILVAGYTAECITVVTLGPDSAKFASSIQLCGEQVVALASKGDTTLVVLLKRDDYFRVDIIDVRPLTRENSKIDYLSCGSRTLLENDQIQLSDPQRLVLSPQDSGKCLVFLQDSDRRDYIVFEA